MKEGNFAESMSMQRRQKVSPNVILSIANTGSMLRNAPYGNGNHRGGQQKFSWECEGPGRIPVLCGEVSLTVGMSQSIIDNR
jgi:hypothetical protein